MPPGLVTLTISSAMRSGSGTCSSTLEEKQTSTDPVANGRSSALPSTACSGGSPSRSRISPASQSTQTVLAPRARSASAKYPGPPPMSATVAPARPV